MRHAYGAVRGQPDVLGYAVTVAVLMACHTFDGVVAHRLDELLRQRVGTLPVPADNQVVAQPPGAVSVAILVSRHGVSDFVQGHHPSLFLTDGLNHRDRE